MNFYKYQCCGNDFIITEEHISNPEIIQRLCDRRYGIGADGLIFVKSEHEDGFRLFFYNKDGSTDTLCGNGSLCSVDYAVRFLNVEKNNFIASDGNHQFVKNHDDSYQISLNNTAKPYEILFNSADKRAALNENISKGFFVNTGSPHFVIFVEDVQKVDVKTLGRYFRYNINKLEGGCNVDFVTILDSNTLQIKTFERGVEGETLSCGTGSVASAITYAEMYNKDLNHVTINNNGGQHLVSFYRENDFYEDIKLQAKPEFVFKGEVSLV
ncbi:diaminopimelate epimerase [Bacteroidales bacterium OttesenSCG-928-K03]|nr:diaminopimelate epimerase [Odoribacter sp. OttesenSCG-928-L07]MDL2239398.1 diaminopimelate epimerase [Bacteroidales bacterium OttesenSCG-928-L14]MDL2240742.1 diaminopimelate epimerase [Bacteroidales bacterium OttesenSCG-928-K22]MDL2242737.1 diaminopimelate epimerase [Bacteroidales bacterium OttesenSCG-928-K03]